MRSPLNADEIAKLIKDLLQVAQVAMPAELFGINPKILRAQALAAK